MTKASNDSRHTLHVRRANSTYLCSAGVCQQEQRRRQRGGAQPPAQGQASKAHMLSALAGVCCKADVDLKTFQTFSCGRS